MATKHSIYKELQLSVAEAVQLVVNMESAWSPPEMTNRIVGYIARAVLKELPLSSPEAMMKMVDSAMQSFSAACQNKPWFYEINLVNAFVGVIMVVEKQEGCSHGYIQEMESLYDMVRLQYEAYQDRILLNRAMWDSVGATFKDDKVAAKVYKALSNTWDSVLQESMAEPLSVPDMTRMQNFIKRWMQMSMWRCWDIVNSENVTLLFENCVRPFGNDHPFSCIPHILYIRSRNLPPKNWSYIRDEAENMFDQWASMKRTKYKRNIRSDPEEENKPKRMKAIAHEDQEDKGHPQCTSKEHCFGSAEDRLVQHIEPAGDEGDIYCTSCFSLFRETTECEGRYTDTNEMF